MPGSRIVARGLCSRASSSARSVGMPPTGNGSAPVPAKASPAPTPITAASGRMRLVLVVSASVRIRQCARTCSIWPSGGQSGRCWPTRSGWRRNIGAACSRRLVPTAHPLPPSKSSSPRGGTGSHGESTVMPTDASTSLSVSRGEPAHVTGSLIWMSHVNSWQMRRPCTRNSSCSLDGWRTVLPRSITGEPPPTGRANGISCGRWSSGSKGHRARSILCLGSIPTLEMPTPKKKVGNFVGGVSTPPWGAYA